MGILSGVANAVKDTVKDAAKTAYENIKENGSDMLDSILGNNDRAKIILGGYPNSDFRSADAAKAIEFELPFNPSSIRIDAMAGGMRPVVSTKGTVMQPLDPRIQVSFTAYVDEVNSADAFLFERVDRSGVVGIAKTVYHVVKNEEYSVTAYVEGLLAALRDTGRSQIWFLWGDMKYGGTLNNVSAKYTMFNPSGNPIKAEIAIRIMCISTEKKTMKAEWESKYENAMKELKSYGGSRMGIDLSGSSITDRILG